jgi:hypothetical protein
VSVQQQPLGLCFVFVFLRFSGGACFLGLLRVLQPACLFYIALFVLVGRILLAGLGLGLLASGGWGPTGRLKKVGGGGRKEGRRGKTDARTLFYLACFCFLDARLRDFFPQ